MLSLLGPDGEEHESLDDDGIGAGTVGGGNGISGKRPITGKNMGHKIA